jgi:hypothetical protein
MLGHVQKRYGLRDLGVRTGIEEELFVVTAERQFTHEGPRLLAELAREMFAQSGGPTRRKVPRPIEPEPARGGRGLGATGA